jgi:hypothetical protein
MISQTNNHHTPETESFVRWGLVVGYILCSSPRPINMIEYWRERKVQSTRSYLLLQGVRMTAHKAHIMQTNSPISAACRLASSTTSSPPKRETEGENNTAIPLGPPSCEDGQRLQITELTQSRHSSVLCYRA